MKQNFESALAAVLVHEGGYVNHPKDPGGATNKGVTWRTYNAWRKRQNLPERNVREITDREVAAIYRAQYWNAVRGDDLPSGVDYAVFDFAVNSGPARAAQFLQRIVGVTADGVIGELTVAAGRKADPAKVITALCDNRLAWLKRLKTWSTFGRGWERRVVEVKTAALALARGAQSHAAATVAPGKADGGERPVALLAGIVKEPAVMTAGAGLLGSAGTLVQGDGPVQYALAAVLVIGALVAVLVLAKSARKEA